MIINDNQNKKKSFKNCFIEKKDFEQSFQLRESFVKNYEKNKGKEIFLSLRIKQLNFLIYTFIISNTYLLTYIILKYFIIPDQFDITNFTSTPETHMAVMFSFIFGIASLAPSFVNYISFYFLIRKNFRQNGLDEFFNSISVKGNNNSKEDSQTQTPKGLLLTEDLVNKVKTEETKINNNISDFLD